MNKTEEQLENVTEEILKAKSFVQIINDYLNQWQTDKNQFGNDALIINFDEDIDKLSWVLAAITSGLNKADKITDRLETENLAQKKNDPAQDRSNNNPLKS